MNDRLSTKAGVFESGEKDVMGVQYKDGRVISCRNSKLEDYAVAEGTVVVCDRAFMNLKELRSLKLPDTLRAIGESAFSGCKALTDINIPEGVTEIRQATFRDCDALAAIELPASVTVIEKFAFGRGLTTLVVNAPEMSIDKYAFMNARDFSTLIVPAGRADYYRSLFFDIRVKAEVEESETEDNESQSMSDMFASADEANGMTKGLFKSNNMEEEKEKKTVTVDVCGTELSLEPKDPDKVDIYKSSDTEEQVRKVKIVLWGEGMRLDCRDDAGDLLECHNALSAATDLFEIKVLDEGEIREIQKADLGESIGKFDDEDPDFEKCDFKTGCSLYEPADDGISQIDYVQTKIYGDIDVDVIAGKKFDPAKARLIWSEFVLPDSEEPVYIGLFYDGKQYPIELDIDSEREISTETIWEE